MSASFPMHAKYKFKPTRHDIHRPPKESTLKWHDPREKPLKKESLNPNLSLVPILKTELEHTDFLI